MARCAACVVLCCLLNKTSLCVEVHGDVLRWHVLCCGVACGVVLRCDVLRCDALLCVELCGVVWSCVVV